MKQIHILIIAIGLIAGAGTFAAISSSGKDKKQSEQLKQELANAQAKIQALEEARKESSRRTLDDIVPAPSPVSEDSDAEVTSADDEPEEEQNDDPASQFAKMMNSKEARSLMKQFSTAMSGRGENWIKQRVAGYKERYGLTDAQAESISTRLSHEMEKGTEQFSQALDNEGKSIGEIMESQRDSWSNQQGVVDEIMKDTLTEEQYAEHEREQLSQQAKQVQRRADWELNQLNRSLELDDSQQDQVFEILVRNSSGYDESMQIEGTNSTSNANAGADVTKEDAIRSVLTPEQSTNYETYLEKSPTSRFGRFRGFGR